VDLYDLLLFVHVLAAAVWTGGALMSYVLAERMFATTDRTALRNLLDQAEKVGMTYFMPASLTTLVAGILLVLEGGWGWGEVFVSAGLVLIVATIVVGAVLMTPREKALAEALNTPDSSDADVRSAFMKIRTLSRIDVALLVIAIFFMTVKPGT
jgi:uncharacterized membrane protein